MMCIELEINNIQAKYKIANSQKAILLQVMVGSMFSLGISFSFSYLMCVESQYGNSTSWIQSVERKGKLNKSLLVDEAKSC